MTLGELRELIAELDELGAVDSTTITGSVRGLDSRVTRLAAKVVRFGDPERRPGSRPFGQLDDAGHLADVEDHELWRIAAWLPAGREGEVAAFLAEHGIEVYRMWRPCDEQGTRPE
jgi:hypothetical protein